MRKEEEGISRPQDQTKEFITFTGESSIRRGVHLGDEAEEE